MKALITDLDGVLRHFPRERDREIELRYGLPDGVISRVAFSEELLNPVITGRMADLTWRTCVAQRILELHPEVDGLAAVHAWSAFSGVLAEDVHRTLVTVARSIPLVLLTNATSRLRDDLSELGILNLFSEIINSSEVGVAKPQREIFQHLFVKLRLAPQDVCFVDDSEANVRAARAEGIASHHFIDHEDFRGFLQATLHQRFHPS